MIPKPPWKERKQAYVDHLAAAQPDVLLVSLVDKVHNLRSIVLDHRFVGVGRHANDMSALF